MWGSWYKHAIHVHLISTCNYPLTQGGFTPQYIASCNGHSDVVKTMIQNGADINLASEVYGGYYHRITDRIHIRCVMWSLLVFTWSDHTKLPTATV